MPGTQAAINAEKVVVPIPADFVLPESVHELVRALTQTIYRQGDERSKARAAICTTYARCIADDFYTARDMLLMSHLQVGAYISSCACNRCLCSDSSCCRCTGHRCDVASSTLSSA